MIGASFDSTKPPLQDLLQRIETATGKTIPREPALFQPGAEVETYDEGPEDWEDGEALEEAAS